MPNRPRLTIVTNDPRAVFQNLVIRGFREVAEPQGFPIRVVDTMHASTSQALSDDSGGFLIIANAVPDKRLIDLYARGVPLSLISHQLLPYPIPSVMFNNNQGIGLLVKHLVEGCGRRHIVYMGGIPQQFDAVQREKAFRHEMLRYGLHVPEHYLLRGDFSPDTAIRSMAAFVAAGYPFDAVLAADYIMAEAVAATLRSQGIRVPHDVSVVGFGDAADAERAGITTVAADVSELGRRAARQLISQIDGLKIRGVTTISVEMVIRESCGYHYIGTEV
jgi:DNA-binding LacI/PurR family transcriptional regulator